MNVYALRKSESLKGQVSEAEWQARVELAAAYRLMDHFDMTDLSHNQVCLRLPDDPNSFLIKPLDAFFHEVRASTLEKYQLDGTPDEKNPSDQLRAGGNFHAEIFKARPDINATLHGHTTACLAVASQKNGLMMMDQHGLHFVGRIAYHEYYGQEADKEVTHHLIRDLADKQIVFMRNHGALITAKSIGSAFVIHHQLDLACRAQIAALSAGEENVVLVSEEAQQRALKRWRAHPDREWPNPKYWLGLLRLADERFPDYKE